MIIKNWIKRRIKEHKNKIKEIKQNKMMIVTKIMRKIRK